MNIALKKLTETAKLPERGSVMAAGYDLFADLTEEIEILPHTTTMIGTGIAVAIPEGYFGGVYARSGLSAKEGLRPANCTGVVDADYRGEIKVALHNDSDEKRRYWNFGGGLDDAFIFKHQSDAIRALAAEGSAIFVGRCSNYILRDMNSIDIFISAPFDLRVKEVAAREGISEASAERKVARIDRERAEYYNLFTLGKWGAAKEYHLCIDASILGIKKTAELICGFVKSIE